MVLDVDLNVLPAERLHFEDDVTSFDLHHEHKTIFEGPGSFSTPIDADAIDDEVVLLPSSAWFSMAKNQSRRKRPAAVAIDENLETDTLQSGVVKEPEATLSLAIQKLRTQDPLEMMIVDCNFNANENCIPKMMNRGMKPISSTWNEASSSYKELALTCPVCLGSLKEPSTTICGHLYCRSCIEIAISKQKKCPTCRKKLTKRNFHRIYFS